MRTLVLTAGFALIALEVAGARIALLPAWAPGAAREIVLRVDSPLSPLIVAGALLVLLSDASYHRDRLARLTGF
ncbi:MAG: hypothetical protein JRG92_21545 [Deltaproteobacteria bacterium]|nr:hypothetical protein [Deltaproteobacteria bacterium]MBW2386220.1 hypothetical protein [Deltaproteobacteria bacterium]